MRSLITTFLFVLTVQAGAPLDFREVAKKATSAVVSVRVEMKSSSGRGDPLGDDFWQRFFNVPRESQTPQIGQGSGFLIDSEGTILTNNHIVEQAERIVVTLQNGKEYPAKVLGRDENSDVAVIKIDAKNLPSLKLGDSSKLEVGEWVIAIGNPLGLQATLTVGVVSAVDRSNLGLAQIEDFIQTDAAINRGNSGGPLLNLEGEVVGMNTAIASNTGGYMGIGFAIPTVIIEQIMQQLVTNGSFTRGYIGVAMQEFDQSLREAFHLEDVGGALVVEVTPGSPAEKAGLKRGDILKTLNGVKVTSVSTVRNKIAMMKPNEALSLTLLRDGKEVNLSLTVGSHPNNLTSSKQTPKLGLTVASSEEKGVVVTGVESGSIAQLAGIRKGALIVSINQKEITTPEEFAAAVAATPKERPVLLLVKQGSITQYVSLKSS